MTKKQRPTILVILTSLLITVALAGSANAASVTAAFAGSPVTVQAGSSGTLNLQLTVWGKTGSADGNNGRVPTITYCDTVQLHSDGSVTCAPTALVLTAGVNYSKGGTPTVFTEPITIVVDADVPCGITYPAIMDLTASTGAGIDFGAYGSTVRVSYQVVVTCPTVVGDEGCSHGYWKTHQSAWTSAEADITLGEIFALPGDFASLAGDDLLAALKYKGGSTVVEKGKLLLLQAAAAYLNAHHLDHFPYTEDQLVTSVNAAFAIGVTAIEALQSDLDRANNLHCSLK